MSLSLLGLLLIFIIAALAGWIGKSIVGYPRGGILLAAGVGFVGAIIGMWLSSELGLPAILTVQVEGQAFPFVWTVIGAMLFSLVIGAIASR